MDQSDIITKPSRYGPFGEQAADRVQQAAKKPYGSRILQVYIANVQQQYGVGIPLHTLTSADVDAFFEATCLRRGDVVFREAPVSKGLLAQWRARVTERGERRGLCLVYDEADTGVVTVGIREGHPELRREIEAAIPAENLNLEEGGCPVPA